MPRIKSILLVFLFSILLTACSPRTWSHTYEGNSSNWQIVLEVVPHKEYGAMFIGTLDQRIVQPIHHVHFEMELKNSGRGGNLKQPDFQKGPIQIFTDYPNSDSYQQEFKDGQYEVDIQQYFTTKPVLTITWKDGNGQEYKEIIELTLKQSR